MINLVAVQAVTKVLFGQSAVGQFRSHLPLGLALLIFTALAAILAPAVRAEQKIQVKPDPELAAVVNMTTVERQSNVQNIQVKNVESSQGNKVSFASSYNIKSLVDARTYALELVNRDRVAHGLNPLVPNPFLDQVAQAHAEDMLRRNYFDHNSPEGETAVERCIKAGGNPKVGVGENLMFYHNPRVSGLATETLQMFQTSWMNSAHHRVNILNSEIVGFGFGVVVGSDGREYAVQLFSLD
jgi:uncharacterized protein YkwD